jgi:RNA polymerase sigma factor (sigma-70 family)
MPRSALTGPSTHLNRSENQAAIENALEHLSPDHREVILLRYFEGMTAEEAGKRMNRSAGAVRNLTSRALIELGTHLGTHRK